MNSVYLWYHLLVACLFLEFLESDPFKHITPQNSTYTDEILLIHTHKINLLDIMKKHNKVEACIEKLSIKIQGLVGVNSNCQLRQSAYLEWYG